jgi:hypothetical protein
MILLYSRLPIGFGSSGVRCCALQTSARKARQVSTSALIKMLIICAAMLAIQLLAYFVLQPVPH